MVKVLFVCLGNICRSPLAEAIFNKRIKEAQLERRFLADSAGTSAYHIGDPPDQRSASNALENGVKVKHSARQFTKADFYEFDYILAMDHGNLQHIESMAQIHGVSHNGIFLICSFQSNGQDLEVPDPYYGGKHGFQQVFEILDDCNLRFIKYLVETH
jgi:protein-tyrosine phosphatase